VSGRSSRSGEQAERRVRIPARENAAGASPRTMLAAVRAVITLFAAAGGVACFMLLTGLHVNDIVALLLGLGFALLARQAATSLAGEWLLARARRAAGQTSDGPPPVRITRP
jgi:hypothetical protein